MTEKLSRCTERAGISRRGVLGTMLAAGAAIPLGVALRSPGALAATTPVPLTLPAPTGPYPVGTVPLRLIDTSRPTPPVGNGQYRELMVSVWYPARDGSREPVSAWLTPAELGPFFEFNDLPADVALAPPTAGHVGAPVRRGGERLPVVVFSHGAHDHRSDTTIVVQELASHGYLVVTVDHTFDAFSQFPDGRLTVPINGPGIVPGDFATDIRFVLDRVEDLAAGRNPDADRRSLPAGLLGAPDPGRVGAYGWSKGGTAIAIATGADERIRAGLSLDGPMQANPPLTTDIDRPFMLMSAENTVAAQSSVTEFWSHLRGWRLEITAEEAAHPSYTDLPALVAQLVDAGVLTPDLAAELVGTIKVHKAVRIQQAYPLAFFDQHLRGRHSSLLDGPSPAFPKVWYRH
jgi:predicted dienelactone hydrolase